MPSNTAFQFFSQKVPDCLCAVCAVLWRCWTKPNLQSCRPANTSHMHQINSTHEHTFLDFPTNGEMQHPPLLTARTSLVLPKDDFIRRWLPETSELQVGSLQSLTFYSVVIRQHFQPAEDWGELHQPPWGTCWECRCYSYAHSRPVQTGNWDWEIEICTNTPLFDFLVLPQGWELLASE